jgi:uncharacterized membrane protein HdeD (DUF308 family)
MTEPLDMRLKAGAVDTAQRYAPWRPDIPWWIVGIQGVVALLLGILLFFNQGATGQFAGLVGLVFLLVSAAWAWSAMRSALPQIILGWRGLRAGVGVATGALIVLDVLVDFLSGPGALIVLCVGLFLAGLIGVVEWAVGRETMGWRWPSLIGSAVALAYGAIVLFSRLQAGELFLQVIAAAAVIGGIVLIVRAALLWRAIELAKRGPGGDAGGSTPSAPVRQATVAPDGTPPSVTVRSGAAPRQGGGTPPEPPAAGGAA